jgi:hypothetical protein
MKKALLLFSVLFGLIPISCIKTPGDSPAICGGGSNNVRDFHIKSFNIKTTDLTYASIDTTLYNDFNSTAKMLRVATRTDAFIESTNFSFFVNTANACSLRQPVSKESVSKITIISRSNFALEHAGDHILVGDTITNKFLISRYSGYNTELIENYIAKKEKFYDSVLFRLGRKPYHETYFKFDITIQLSDNSIHVFNGQSLRIK